MRLNLYRLFFMVTLFSSTLSFAGVVSVGENHPDCCKACMAKKNLDCDGNPLNRSSPHREQITQVENAPAVKASKTNKAEQ